MNTATPPRIAIVHYHMRRGGVTRVIASATRALQALDIPVVVMTGEPPETRPGPDDAPLRVIPGLAYDSRARCDREAVQDLIRELKTQAASALGGAPDVWHFHNTALGKNPAVSLLPDSLAREGIAVLLQCHDFAEDQRPQNWKVLVDAFGNGNTQPPLEAPLYPQAPHAHLAVLNARDRQMLVQAGAAPEQVVLLPNPVTATQTVSAGSPSKPDRPLWLYPTRAIRRKNLGEFVLWAAASGADADFVTTLEPTNPLDMQMYAEWVRLAESLKLPIRFGAGLAGETAFQDLLHKATSLVTTSIAEGFGLAFLEPWLIGKPLAGRKLGDITADMEAAGVDLSMLYEQVAIPLAWVDRSLLRNRLDKGLMRAYRYYGVALPPDATEWALAAITHNDTVDFGGLDESLQRQVVRHLADSPQDAAAMKPAALRTCAPDAAIVDANRQATENRYALGAYGRHLRSVYQSLLRSPANNCQHVSPAALLQQFLSPERFRLLRTGAED